MPELFLTIPCEPGKRGDHLNGPIYIYDGRDSMRAYQCPHCGQTGPRIRPLRDHMGMTMNKKANERNDLTFTLVGQDLSSPRTIAFWILENIHTAPAEKLQSALTKAIRMRSLPNRKPAD